MIQMSIAKCKYIPLKTIAHPQIEINLYQSSQNALYRLTGGLHTYALPSYSLPCLKRSTTLLRALWHFPKPIAQLQRDNVVIRMIGVGIGLRLDELAHGTSDS